MGKACNMNGVKKNVCRLLMFKPEGKRPLGRPRHRCVDNIKMAVGDRMGWCGLDWSGLK
jgi:hypothetical protein